MGLCPLGWVLLYRKKRIVEEFEDWNNKTTGEPTIFKIGLVLEDDFTKTMRDNFSAYCKPVIPCLQKLWKEVFPRGRRRLSEDRELYSRMVDVLVEAREGVA